jgi:hypothetical protein
MPNFVTGVVVAGRLDVAGPGDNSCLFLFVDDEAAFRSAFSVASTQDRPSTNLSRRPIL